MEVKFTTGQNFDSQHQHIIICLERVDFKLYIFFTNINRTKVYEGIQLASGRY